MTAKKTPADDLRSLISDYYIAFAFMAVLYAVPNAYAMSAGLCVTVVVGVVLYRLRAARRTLADGDKNTADLGHAHAQFLIKLFWRFCWISALAMLAMGGVIAAIGDNTALNEMQDQIMAGTVLDEQAMMAYLDRYETANADLKIAAHLATFVPFAAYFLWRLLAGWRAAKTCDAPDPKAWC